MVSLSKLMTLDEEGVRFESPHTKEITNLPPEECIRVQQVHFYFIAISDIGFKMIVVYYRILEPI